MQRHHAFIAVSFIAALCTHAAAQESAPVKPANPMAPFARMLGGEWKMTCAAGTSLFDTWHWGPGRRSLRVMTDGDAADGSPWRALTVIYWHPARKQIRSLGLSPYAAGVAEATITFNGESAESVIDMYQTGHHRNLKSRWKFDGPDKYHDELLETTGPEGYFPLAEWDRFRVAPPAKPRSRAVEAAPKPSERLRPFRSLLDRTWKASAAPAGDLAASMSLPIESTIEWIPLANGIYARMLMSGKHGEPMHFLDAYAYHHTGTGSLQCLALSNQGGVYEGKITVLDDGSLQFDLNGFEGDRVVPYTMRIDFEKDGTLRNRIWTLNGSERTLTLDIRHKPLDPKKE